jgi:hypothetical protein
LPLIRRDPAEVFRNILEFLDNNPREVLVITLQVNSSPETAEKFLNDVYAILAGVNGFVERMYAHTWPDPWPTLRHLIDSDQRIIFFHFNGPRCQDVPCPPGLIDYFFFAEETPFSFETLKDFDNVEQSCNPSRGYGGTLDFFGVNYFLEIPDRSVAATMYSRENVRKRIQDCSQFNTKNSNVNFILVDFW